MNTALDVPSSRNFAPSSALVSEFIYIQAHFWHYNLFFFNIYIYLFTKLKFYGMLKNIFTYMTAVSIVVGGNRKDPEREKHDHSQAGATTFRSTGRNALQRNIM